MANAKFLIPAKLMAPFDLEQRKALIQILGYFEEQVADGGLTALEVEVDNLNAWATALATKLNADAGVTDTNYDTDPQA